MAAARPVVSVYGADGSATAEQINLPAVFKVQIYDFTFQNLTPFIQGSYPN